MKKRLEAWGETKITPIVAALVFSEDGELLLLQRHTDDLGGGQWGPPGGRIERSETPRAAISREFFEETGIKVSEFRLLGAHKVHMPHGTVHMTSYQATISKKARIIIDPEEHHAYAWRPVVTLPSDNDILWGVPSVLRDFGLLDFGVDPTLADGSFIELIERARAA